MSSSSYFAQIVYALLLTALCLTMGSGVLTTPPSNKLALPITFESSVCDKGIVKGGSLISHEFDFTVWPVGTAKIVDIKSSCGCTIPDATIIGKELTPGSKHSVKVSVRPKEGLAPMTQTLQIRTAPPSPVPIELSIRYHRRPSPSLLIDSLELTGEAGEVAEGSFQIVYARRDSDKPLPLNIAKCESSLVDIVSVKVTSVRETDEQNREKYDVVDTTVVRVRSSTPLRSRAYQEGRIKLIFSDGSQQMLPVSLKVAHPFQLGSPYVFCGVLHPGQSVSSSIPFKRPDTTDLVARFDLVVNNQQEINFELDISKQNQIVLKGRAPRTKGRFEGKIVVSFDEDKADTITVPFFGVVR